MIVARIIVTLLIICTSSLSAAYSSDALTIDKRIKTHIYNPNEVYLLTLHSGFQSSIEFAPNEIVESFSLGDSYAWKITPHGKPHGNKLIMKPMEANIRTNMMIMTNLRTYQLDIVSKEFEPGKEQDLIYTMRFQSPKKSRAYRSKKSQFSHMKKFG